MISQSRTQSKGAMGPEHSSVQRQSKLRDSDKRKLQNTRALLEVKNLDGPSFFSYNIPQNPPRMRTSPAYTFRPKTQSDRAGGQQKAWGKEWFAHNHVWLQKADFDPRLKWPSPTDYDLPDGIGKRSPCHPRSSSYTFGKRKEFTLVRKGAEKEPGPGTYNYETGKDRTMFRPKASSIRRGNRIGNYLWGRREPVPGPGSYNPIVKVKKQGPSFSFPISPRRLDYSARVTL